MYTTHTINVWRVAITFGTRFITFGTRTKFKKQVYLKRRLRYCYNLQGGNNSSLPQVAAIDLPRPIRGSANVVNGATGSSVDVYPVETRARGEERHTSRSAWRGGTSSSVYSGVSFLCSIVKILGALLMAPSSMFWLLRRCVFVRRRC